MLTATATAFKEWACVVQALSSGEQILILRKGGIHEKGKAFSVLHDSFFLFPTYEHQKEEDLNPRGQELLHKVKAEPPLTDFGHVTFQFFAEIKENLWLEDFDQLQKLAPFHVWSENALKKRFTWGENQGVHALAVRVYRLPNPQSMPNLPAYGGCRSWIDLKNPQSLSGIQPVQSDRAFETKLEALKKALTS